MSEPISRPSTFLGGSLSRTAAFLLACVAMSSSALSQTPYPQQDGRHPICMRLEGQLTALDRSGADPRGEQLRRYEEAAARQQQELDRTISESRRLGCQGVGFFMFGGSSPQCDQLNNQVQRQRSNLDRIVAGMQQMRGASGMGDEQRRSILLSLGQYDCGPQYRTAATQQRPRGIFDTFFGNEQSTDPGMQAGDLSSTFRTICVRTCDGFFFPISSSTVPGRFRDDERICQRQCPATEVQLFSHRASGEDVSRAVSLTGKQYSELPNAFRYRQQYDSACSCKRAGESWAEALAGADDRIERGDIVVTDDKAKALARPRQEPPTSATRPQDANRNRTRAGTTEASAQPKQLTEPAAPSAPPATAAETPATAPRNVGPQFYR